MKYQEEDWARVVIPKPPSKEAIDLISREQAMITDEWTGDPVSQKNGLLPDKVKD